MRYTLVLGHPAPGSFNHAIAAVATETLRGRGHEVHVHDLYAEGFDPVMTAAEIAKDAVLPAGIEAYCREVETVDGIVIVHPNWWSAPPAILRGWVDRVLRPGRAYQFVADGQGGAKPVGLLRAQAALVLNTANMPQEKEEALYGDPLHVHWLKVVFGTCGIKRVLRRIFSPVVISTPKQRSEWLDEVRLVAEGLDRVQAD
jgi:NAD(P)H dehydrogenase (quinone)